MSLALAVLLMVVLGFEATVHTWAGSVVSFVSSLGLAAAAWLLRRHPLAAGATIVIAGIIYRIELWGRGMGDQIITSQAAGIRAFSGLNPYGVSYAESVPPGAPFPYGPLGLIWWAPGVLVEFCALVLLLGVLWLNRYWIALAFAATWTPLTVATTSGANDYSPALLVAVALLLVPKHPRSGAATLAVAAALKPYAFAWYLPVLGYVGWSALAPLTWSTVLLWWPVALWGPGAYYESIRMAEALPHHTPGENALNIGWLRVLAIPAALLGLIVRSWEGMLLSGAATFLIVLWISAGWASFTYWMVVTPPILIAVESLGRSCSPRLASWVKFQWSCRVGRSI